MALARKIGESIAAMSIGNFILTFAGFGGTLILVNELSLYDYGLLTLALSLVGISEIILSLTIQDVITSDVSRFLGTKRLGEVKNLLTRFTQVEIILGIIIFLSLYIAANTYIRTEHGEQVSRLVMVFAILPFLNSIKYSYYVAFRSHMRFKVISFANISENVGRFISIAFLVFFLKYGLIGGAISYLLGTFTGILIGTPYFIKIINNYRNIENIKEEMLIKTIKGHGKWAIIQVPFKNLSGNIRPWIIQFFLGVEMVAIFSVARSTLGFFSSLFPIREIIFPTLSHGISDLSKTKEVVYRGIKYSLLVFGIITILSYFATPFLFKILFPKYMDSVPIFRILIFHLIVLSFQIIQRPIFYALQMQKIWMYLIILNFFLILLIGVPLAFFLGLPGIAFEFVLSSLIMVIVRFFILRKNVPELSFNLKKLFTIDKYDRKLAKDIFIEIKKYLKRSGS